jgi:leader peptidase (prepilin peptidase)/N-methyltransferase
VLGRALFHKEAMGFGDVKLMAFVGGFVGWRLVLLTIMLGACIGAVVGLLSLLRSRDTRMPFGPYLSLGALIAMLHSSDIVAAFERFTASLSGMR